MTDIIRASGRGKSVSVAAFTALAKKAAERAKQARLIFGLDLTASREDTLEKARIATAKMFDAIRGIGSLAMKFVYYRGDECRASKWQNDPGILSGAMQRLSCQGGTTQISRILGHAIKEMETGKISAVIFVGDHCQENSDKLIGLAQTFKGRSVPLFIFHECADHDSAALEARPTFQRMAEVSGGMYCAFNSNSGMVLQELLLTVAAFSTAGHDGINQTGLPTTPEARKLRGQLLALPPPR